MKEINVLCSGDWHLDSKEENAIKAESSLKEILKYCQNNTVHIIIIPGDVWERSQVDPFYDSDRGRGVELAKKYLEALSNCVLQIFIVKGNNSHDPVGSIAKLHQFRPNIFAYEYPVCLASDGKNVVDLFRNEKTFDPKIIVSLLPYPTKQNFVTEESVDNNTADFIDKFGEMVQLFGDTVKPYDCPTIMGAHLNVAGSVLTTGQSLVSQDIVVSPKLLECANQHYYTLGHIHLKQMFRPYMGYTGSLYNKNWGETEQKSFDVVKFALDTNEDWDFELEVVPFKNARPMVKLEAEFDAEKGFMTLHDPENPASSHNPENSDIRYRVNVKENDRKLITDEKEAELKSLFEDGGNTIEIEYNLVPDNRKSRSETIMYLPELVDEVVEYGRVVDYKVTDSIKDKVQLIKAMEDQL